MSSYILLLFADFEDSGDLEYFINEVLENTHTISSMRYIIEDYKNIIVIFDSSHSQKDISEELYYILNIDHIDYYFLFRRDGLVSANISEEMKNQIYKVVKKDIKFLDKPNISLNIDDILDKIKNFGINSLTNEEKNFLDNFEN